MEQTVTVSVVVNKGLMIRTSVATVSQDVVPGMVSEYVPAAVYRLPYHTYGSWLAHKVTVRDDVISGLTFRTNVAIVSQPLVVLTRVSI